MQIPKMKILKNIHIVIFLFAFCMVAAAQPPATKLNKNRNDKANGLNQSLNKIADTLFLTSDKDILRVNFLSHSTSEKLQVDVGSKNVNIPLYHFGKGRYTIAVYRQDKIIAFDINRIRDIIMPEGASDNLEESMLEASLSDKEKVKRGMKKPPAKKEVIAEKAPEKKVNEAREAKKKQIAEKKQKLAEQKKKKLTKRQQLLEALKNKPKKQSTTMTYNLSRKPNDTLVMQSRDEYRRNNLRPNGKPYD